jgi:hypothetical protein
LVNPNLPTKHVCDLAIPLLCKYKPELGKSIKNILNVIDATRVQQSTETKVGFINSKSKGKALLNLNYKLSGGKELMTWDNGPALILKFKLQNGLAGHSSRKNQSQG